METAPSNSDPTHRKAFTAGNLARDFGPKAAVARFGVGALYEALLAAEHPAASASFQRWQTLFGTACGRAPQRLTAGTERLAKSYGISPAGAKPESLLFALHTYYAVLVKRLIGRAAARFGERPSPINESFPGDPFCWHLAVESEPLRRLAGELADRLAAYDPGTLSESDASGDLLARLYQELFPRSLRHKLGEYYTPDWLADHLLEVSGYTGDPRRRLLDPACGSGTFLVAAIRRIRARHGIGGDREELGRRILAGVVGFDLNPLAVLAARANYLMALGDLLPQMEKVEIPVHLCDSIVDGPAAEKTESAGPFDYVVGNPPWIAWDNLPADYRRATRPLWERYGLFSLGGTAGRHGGGKKDLSMLMLHVSADRYLKHRGRLAMVITQTLFQTKGAGDGFRRFRLGPDGEPLKVLRVDDMVELRPFDDAANWTSTIVLQKGSPTQYPVPYLKWSPGADGGGPRQRPFHAEPIEPERPGSPWFLRPEGFHTRLDRLVGPSDYTAYLGANSGGANGVYWVEVLGEADGGVLVRNVAEKSKQQIDQVRQIVEPDLLYPLVRWSDMSRYRAVPSAHLLLPQDLGTRTGIGELLLQSEFPQTYAYLKRFERVLRNRAAYRRYQEGKAFYSMYNVGRYTVAPIKVVWRRMDRRINAAVVEEFHDPMLGTRPVIPQETCALIACDSADEAHYLCAVLNSAIVNFLVTAHSVRGGKGFGTPSMLEFIRLQRFATDDPRHRQLAACSRQAHAAATPEIQTRIDRLAGELWNLASGELDAIL